MSKQNHIFTKIRNGSEAQVLAEILSSRTQKKNGRTISTIGELDRAGMGLQIDCTGCGHGEFVKGRRMRERFGGTSLLKDVREACTACGSAAVSRYPKAVAKAT